MKSSLVILTTAVTAAFSLQQIEIKVSNNISPNKCENVISNLKVSFRVIYDFYFHLWSKMTINSFKKIYIPTPISKYLGKSRTLFFYYFLNQKIRQSPFKGKPLLYKIGLVNYDNNYKTIDRSVSQQQHLYVIDNIQTFFHVCT